MTAITMSSPAPAAEMLTDSWYDEAEDEVSAFDEEPAPSDTATLEIVVQVHLRALLPQLESLQKLGPNWDSYGARPISALAVKRALALLDLARPSVLPDLVPVNDGGLELEWDADGGSLLSVTIAADGAVCEIVSDAFGLERAAAPEVLLTAAVSLIRRR